MKDWQINRLLAEQVMGWKHGVYLRGGGCRPADSTLIDSDPEGKRPLSVWSVSSKGGTYPYFIGGSGPEDDITVWHERPSRFGAGWKPATEWADAMAAADAFIVRFGGTIDLDGRLGLMRTWRATVEVSRDSVTTDAESGPAAIATALAEAIVEIRPRAIASLDAVKRRGRRSA